MAHAAPPSRITGLQLLNKQRWEAHKQQHEEETGVPMSKTMMTQQLPNPVPTAGALFNRPNPLRKDGTFNNPYVRAANDGNGAYDKQMRGKLMFLGPDGQWVKPEDPEQLEKWRKSDGIASHEAVPVYGYDWWTSLKPNSHRKYRIPRTSVVNKVGDLRIFCYKGWRLTAVRCFKHDVRDDTTVTACALRFGRRNGSGTHKRKHPLSQTPPITTFPCHTVRTLPQVAEPLLLRRAHDHGLPHAPLCLLAVGTKHVARHRARDRQDLPLHADPDARDDRQQRVELV